LVGGGCHVVLFLLDCKDKNYILINQTSVKIFLTIFPNQKQYQ